MTNQTRDEFEQTMEIEREAPLVPAITPQDPTSTTEVHMTNQTRDEFEQTMEIEREAPLVPAITPRESTSSTDTDIRRELSTLQSRLDQLEAAIRTQTEN